MERIITDPNVSVLGERASGLVVRVGRDASAYKAFVPHPLPPPLTIDLPLATAISEADRSIGELAGLGRTMANPDLLIAPFIRREAVLSSRIEGTQATITDIYSFEAGDATAGARRRPAPPDVQEVINYVDATHYGLDRISTLPVSVRLMKELHARLLRGVRGADKSPGEFRRSQNWIGAPNCLLNEASYVPPPVAQMEEALAELEQYIHAPAEVHPPLVRLALIHAQFEMVHPFIDGNGRIGRLLVTLLTVNWGLLPLPLLYLSAFFERERDGYYARLLGVSERSEWREWLLFFLRGVAQQSRDAIQRAKRLQDLQATWRDAVTVPRGSTLTVRLVDSLFSSPITTVSATQRLLGVTYPSAKATIDKLVGAGILELFDDRAYGRQWWAPSVLEIVGEPDESRAEFKPSGLRA